MKSFFNLNNKVILITGASGFIGKSVVKQLLIEECKLILILRNSNSFKKLNGLINKKNTFIYYADLNIESDLEAVLNDIKSKFNYIDGIINMSSDSSGLGSAKYKSNFSEFDNAFNNNLLAPIKITLSLKELLIKNQKKRSSSVINISSMYGVLSPDQTIYKSDKFVNPIDYGCSKASQIHMTKYFANDISMKNIRFNNIILGPIPNRNKNFKKQINEKKLLNRIPIGRFGRPNDIIGAILLLLSSRSSFITGSSITIDGGWSSR